MILKNKYVKAHHFRDGLAAVQGNDKRGNNRGWGYIDKTGEEVIPCQYWHACDFHEGLAAVQRGNGLWGYINKSGEEVIPCQFSSALEFHEGLAAVRNKEGLWGYINQNGELVVDYQYMEASPFCEGRAVVQSERGLWGYIDDKGRKITHLTYETNYDFHEGLAAVQRGALQGVMRFECAFINKGGHIVIPYKYYEVGDFHEGLAAVQNKEGLWGYINQNGEEVIPCQYRSALEFHDGFAPIQDTERHVFDYKTGKTYYLWTYIDKNGNRVKDFTLLFAAPFSEGRALALQDCMIGSHFQTWDYYDTEFKYNPNNAIRGGSKFLNGMAYAYDVMLKEIILLKDGSQIYTESGLNSHDRLSEGMLLNYNYAKSLYDLQRIPTGEEILKETGGSKTITLSRNRVV